MTESPTRATSSRPRKVGGRRRRPSAIPVFSALALLVLGTFAYLAIGLANGRDPALGADAISAVTPKRPVIIRKVIKRRVVTTVVPAAPPTTAYASSGYSGGSSSYSAPSTSYTATAPAPAPAPAAPVVTASS